MLQQNRDLRISNTVLIPAREIVVQAIHASGNGGQRLNKVATAIHLRFDIQQSGLPEFYKQKLLSLKDQHISKQGIINIKVMQSRSQEKNRELAMQRLQALICSVTQVQKNRRATRPTRASCRRRLDSKNRRSQLKQQRRKPFND